MPSSLGGFRIGHRLLCRQRHLEAIQSDQKRFRVMSASLPPHFGKRAVVWLPPSLRQAHVISEGRLPRRSTAGASRPGHFHAVHPGGRPRSSSRRSPRSSNLAVAHEADLGAATTRASPSASASSPRRSGRRTAVNENPRVAEEAERDVGARRKVVDDRQAGARRSTCVWTKRKVRGYDRAGGRGRGCSGGRRSRRRRRRGVRSLVPARDDLGSGLKHGVIHSIAAVAGAFHHVAGSGSLVSVGGCRSPSRTRRGPVLHLLGVRDEREACISTASIALRPLGAVDGSWRSREEWCVSAPKNRCRRASRGGRS